MAPLYSAFISLLLLSTIAVLFWPVEIALSVAFFFTSTPSDLPKISIAPVIPVAFSTD